jgi:putative transposase
MDGFKRHKTGSGYPNYKEKDGEQTCRFNNYVTNTKNKDETIRVDFKNHKVLLPTLGWLNFFRSIFFIGKIKEATIIKETDGNYYISICVNQEITKLEPVNKEVGLDLGLKSYIVGSDGTDVKAPKYFRKSKDKLRKAQRKLSKKKIGSNRYNKQKLVVAKLHKKVVHQREDFSQKLSTKIINENQVICLETLKVKNMIQNHKLALSIADASWGKFITMLEYKANWYGRTILKIDTFEPSSKTRHKCGYINKELKLEDREWTCIECGTHHDRDLNASINIYCVAKCPDIEETIDKNIKKVKPCKKVASAGSTHSGCRRTSDSKFIEASNHIIPVELSTGVI